MLTVIEAFARLHGEQREARLTAMQRAFAAFETQRSERADGAFNAFALLGVGTDEVKHSAFLAWLLQADAGHGQGELFLNVFLAACQPSIDLALPERYRVQTEFAGAESIIDVMVYKAGAFLLYIENKTVSPAMPDQHDREFRDLRRLGKALDVPPEAQYAIYLTPRGRPAQGESAGHWRRIAYRTLGAALDGLLPTITDAKTHSLVQDWLDTLVGFAGTWRRTMTGFSPESLLVAEHWNTVLDIIRARDTLDRELTEMLWSYEADLEAQDWWEQGWRFQRHKNRFYIDNPSWFNTEGKAVVYMGVFDFDADHVFGLKSPPFFYVYVRNGYDVLYQELVALLQDGGYTVAAENRYLIRSNLQQCATEREAAEAYPDSLRRQIVACFTQYATLIMRFDETIKQYAAAKDS
ncbi:MAG: PD-(D/E)XK nuclease family protein [Anaerolineae bacterium]|nr:PD-(D/E)XK nuclease family protein [Anaerolineae bacterium]